MTGLALATRVPTSAGWSTVGGLRAGDEVFDRLGQCVRVLAGSVVQHPDCYRVTFANGTSILCGAGHLWVARTGRRKEWRAHETTDLYAARAEGLAVLMPVTEPLSMPDALLPIDPWVLGCWLGDGKTKGPVVTCHVDNQHEISAAISAGGYELGSAHRKKDSNGVHIYVKGGLKKQLARTGLLGCKHVPAQYLRASAPQRLALIHGLVDSDGHVTQDRGRVMFVNTNIALAEAVAELARSLGEMVNFRTAESKGYGRTVIAHRVSWQPSVEPAATSAKLRNYRPRTVAAYRSVKTIERIPPVPTRCIDVDSPTRTFLVGEDMTPTHTTPEGGAR